MNDIRGVIVLCLVLIAGTAIEQAPSVGPSMHSPVYFFKMATLFLIPLEAMYILVYYKIYMGCTVCKIKVKAMNKLYIVINVSYDNIQCTQKLKMHYGFVIIS